MNMKNFVKSSALFAVLSFAAVLAADKLIMPLYVSHQNEIIVPNVLNIDYHDAKRILEKAHFNVTKKQRFDANTPPNVVIQQIPEPLTTVKPGRDIELIVTNNDRMVNVPLLRLSTLRDAQFNLESLGLKIGKIDSQSSNEFPAGIILEQAMEANSKVRIGTPVDLIVSTGNNLLEAKVPFLIHKSLLEAKSQIVESGLRLGAIIKKFSPDLLPGTVIAQSLDSSKTVAPLTTIDLTVSSTNKDDE